MNVVPYVLLCSKGKNTNLTNCIISALTLYGGLQCNTEERIFTTSENPTFSFSSYASMPNTEKLKGVLIFDDNFHVFKQKQIVNCLTPIFHAQNSKAVTQLKQYTKPVITCGTGTKDTFSLASLKNGHATVSLQRDVQDIFGTTIEPMDITVRLQKEHGVYPTLAACATLLLCGISPNNGYSF